MKQIISIFALLAVLSANVFAQEEEAGTSKAMDMRFGIRAGTNWSSMSLRYSGYNTVWGFNSILGFQVGGAAEIPISQVFLGKKDFYIGANPAVMFISKGGDYGLFGIGGEINTYYLEVPVPVSFGTYFGKSQNFGVRAELGPYFAIGLFGSGDGLFEDVKPFDELSRFDAGLTYGVAIQFVGDFYFGMHNSIGFTDDDISTFALTFGYKF